MTPPQPQRSASSWNPLFDFPPPQRIDYFHKLHPLLMEFPSRRELVAQATEAFDASWGEAMVAAGYGFSEEVQEGMALVEQQKLVLQGLSARLQSVGQAILALGDPPNPLEGRRKRKQAYDEARQAVEAMASRTEAPAAGTWTLARVDKQEQRTVQGIPDWTFPSDMRGRMGVQIRRRDVTFQVTPGSLDSNAVEEVKDPAGKVSSAPSSARLGWAVPPSSAKGGQTWMPGLTATVSPGCDGLLKKGIDFTVKANGAGVYHWDASWPSIPAKGYTFPAAMGKGSLDLSLEVGGTTGSATFTYRYVSGGAAPPPEPVVPRPGAQEAALAESIAFHEENIRFLEKNLARDAEELGREPAGSHRSADLQFRLLTGRAEVQAERDLIASLKTGQIVHTRTEWDDYVKDKFIANIRADQQRMEAMQRGAAELQRMAAALPPEEAAATRDFIQRQLTPADLAKGNLAKLDQVHQAVSHKLEGARLQYEAQKELASAERALFWLGAAQKAGGVAAFILGGNTLASMYAGSTGYISGGLGEGIRDAVTWCGQPGYLAVEAYDGYTKGGYLAGAGVLGAVEKTVAAAGLNKLFEWGVGRIGQGSAALENKANLGKPRPAVSGQGFGTKDVARMKQEMAEGERLAKELHTLDQQLAKAVDQKLPNAQLLTMRQKVMDKAAELNGNFYAKLYAKGAKGPLERTAAKWSAQIKSDVDREFKALLRKEGWDVDRLPLKDMRNARSGASLGMDRDYGVSAADLRPGSLMKGRKAGSLSALQNDGSRLYAQAYQKVTGRSADKALHTFTTPIHKEAFKDLGVLNDLRIPGNMDKLHKAFGEQTGWTIYLKGAEMLDPKHLQSIGLSKVAGYMEAGRGLAKELETKIIPFIQQAKGTDPARARSLANHYKGMLEILDTFRKPGGGFDPIEASRKLRAFTGGKDLHQILEDVRTTTEVLHKFGGIGR